VSLNVGLSIAFSSVFGVAGWPPHAGLALANAVATLVELGLLLWLMSRRMWGLEGRQTVRSVAKGTIAAIVMAAVLWVWQRILHDASPLVVGGGGILLGASAYLGVALLLRADELRMLGALLRERARAGMHRVRTARPSED
jgi:putative peptidoglycan lipid II flippase